MFWSLIFGTFEFVSSFDILISDFPVSDKWINCKHFDYISFCRGNPVLCVGQNPLALPEKCFRNRGGDLFA